MISSIYTTINDALLRKIEGRVELHNGSTSPTTFWPDDKLQEVTVSRVGEKGKFFGYGICQQATVKVVDRAGDLVFLKGDKLQTSFRANSSNAYARVCPTFYIKDAVRDEKTNVITITSYDALDSSVSHVFGELGITPPYTIEDVVGAITGILGLNKYSVVSGFDTAYEKGANLTDDMTIRAVLNAIAEATQTIYYIDHNDYLVFKRLDKSGDAVLTINKKDYFELTTALPVTISKIVSATELGDNLFAGNDTGVTQYVRDNPFWTGRGDLDTILTDSINRISGLTIVPFNLKWRGNFLTEIGDKIKAEAKDGHFIDTFILEDSFTYTGGFSQTSDWEYNPESDRATAANPVTIGEKINQTFARVDKIEKNITLYVSDIVDEVLPTRIEDAVNSVTTDLNQAIEDIATSLGKDIEDVEAAIAETTSGLEQDIANLQATTSTHTENIASLTLDSTSINNEVKALKQTTTTITNDLDEVVATQETIQEDMSSLQLTSNQISASVSSVEKKVTDVETKLEDDNNAVNTRIDSVAKDVSLKLDKKGVEIAIESTLADGVEKVVTASKKYTFDDSGLNVSSSDSEISTVVTEDGMRIYRHSTEVLTVDNTGVQAADLHARTFLIIGENSRLEDRGSRTACFWIGPAGG